MMNFNNVKFDFFDINKISENIPELLMFFFTLSKIRVQ